MLHFPLLRGFLHARPEITSKREFASQVPGLIIIEHRAVTVCVLTLIPSALQNMAALLITQQILGQIIESVIPYAMYKWRKHTIIKKQESPESSPLLSKYSELTEDVKKQAEIEGSRDPYLVGQFSLSLSILNSHALSFLSFLYFSVQ